jgi:hypothetical protein
MKLQKTLDTIQDNVEKSQGKVAPEMVLELLKTALRKYATAASEQTRKGVDKSQADGENLNDEQACYTHYFATTGKLAVVLFAGLASGVSTWVVHRHNSPPGYESDPPYILNERSTRHQIQHPDTLEHQSAAQDVNLQRSSRRSRPNLH